MSSTDRQNNLLIAENWQKIYQSFKNANFQSYDFNNLRRTMIDYIRTNFPEDFNDYIESDNLCNFKREGNAALLAVLAVVAVGPLRLILPPDIVVLAALTSVFSPEV